MTIEEILSRWPQTAQLFHRYKMLCVGCVVAQVCTLSEAIKIYKLVEKQVLTELQQELANE